MDEELEQEELPHMTPLGQRLKDAREAKGLSIEDIASTTRIPKRHLENLESGDFASLPAPTYTMGFAKAYAAEVGLDREEVGTQLREEMDGFRPPVEEQVGYEPADPNRAMPRWLVWSALLALIAAIVFFIWYNERELLGAEQAEPPALTTIGQEPEEEAVIAPANRVMLMADETVWVRITDGGETLVETELGPDNSYVVPANASAPLLETARPEALRITVGQRDAPQIGPDGERVANVSLLGADLMRGPQAAPTPAAAPPVRTASTSRPATPPQPAARTPDPAPAQSTSPPPASTTPTTLPPATDTAGDDAAPAQVTDTPPPPPSTPPATDAANGSADAAPADDGAQ